MWWGRNADKIRNGGINKSGLSLPWRWELEILLIAQGCVTYIVQKTLN